MTNNQYPMSNGKKILKEIKELHSLEKEKIAARLADFKKVFKKNSEDELFYELVFCLLTPQSKAKSCWGAIENLKAKNLLKNPHDKKIAKELQRKVRFHNNKAKYVVAARELFLKNGKVDIKSKLLEFKDTKIARDWLVENIKGMGLKEGSHFLRNIGFGKHIAILDRHILKNLKLLGVIKEMPKSLTQNVYFEIEEKMSRFADKIGIPLDHLDLLFWRKETGEYFK